MSSYELDSSAFTHYAGEVLSAKFQYGEQGANEGKPQLVLIMATDDPEVPQWTERFNLGTTTKGGTWEIMEDGDEVIATDLSTKFRDNAQYGKWISAAVKAAKINPKTGVDGDGKQWGDTKEAETWIGTCWQMEPQPFSFTNRETKEEVSGSKNYPTKYLGMQGIEQRLSYGEEAQSPVVASSAASGNGGVGGTTAAGAAVLEYEPILSQLEPSQIASLMEAAKSMEFGSWSDFALESCLESLTDPAIRGRFITEVQKPTGGLYEVMKG